MCDQMKMLQVSWSEVLTLQVAQRSLPFTGKIYFATDFWLDDRSAKECGALELFNHVSRDDAVSHVPGTNHLPSCSAFTWCSEWKSCPFGKRNTTYLRR